MHVYFDTSLVLAILQNESTSYEATASWNEAEMRFSSVLLMAEGMITLRRNTLGRVTSDPALVRREVTLKRMLLAINLIPVDEPILKVIEREPRLSRCRSQDALHLATALYIQNETGDRLTICSYDTRMRETARDLGFSILPADA